MKPTIGRIVWYTLNDADAVAVRAKRLARETPGFPLAGNTVTAGQVFPAVIVRVWGDTPESAVNLQVLLDGDDAYWATSRQVGEGEGRWAWPERSS
jgi:hypothetical protein